MKKPFYILVETSNHHQSVVLLSETRSILKQDGINLSMVNLPSDGPLGHLIRVQEQNRLSFDFHAEIALKIIDTMDAFYNPVNGILKNNQEMDVILLEGIFMRTFAGMMQDQSRQNWFRDICKILPAPQIILHEETETDQVTVLKSIWETACFSTLQQFKEDRNTIMSAWAKENDHDPA